LAVSIGPSFLLAADTRSVDFGSPGAPGSLSFSPVTLGGRTVLQLEIKNSGGQTLNHIKFAGGDVADTLPYNDILPKPTGTSLPAGASIAAVFPSAGCTISANGAGLLCDVGSLGANASTTYAIVINPPAGAGPHAVWLTASWNEGWSTTGANADYTFASGSFSVGTAGCSTPAASYFLPAEALSLINPCGSQSASVSSGALGGNGGFGSVGIDSTFGATCPDAYSCFGSTVAVTIADGSPVSGGVQWDVTWTGTKSLKGVIHFHDDYDPTDSDTYDVILFQKKFQCSATLETNCWVSTESSKGNADPLTFRAVFVTPNNGKAGGFI
jgi:hypothetical protein